MEQGAGMRSVLRAAVTALALASSMMLLTVGSAAARPRLGVQGSLRWTELTYHWSGGDLGAAADLVPHPAFHAAWSAGLVADWPLTRRVGIVTGLRYAEAGEVQEHSADFTGVTARSRDQLVLRSVSAPVQVRWRPGAAPVHVAAGVDVSWLAQALNRPSLDLVNTAPAAAVRGPRPAAAIFEDVSHGIDLTDAFRRWRAGASVGVGVDRSLGSLTARLEARWTEGLTDVVKSSDVQRRVRAIDLMLTLLR